MRKIILLLITFFAFISLTNAEILENNTWTTTQTWAWIPENITPPTSHLEEKSKTKYTYFYGATCPHCIETDSFFKKAKIYENFDIIKKEVWSDKKNALEMTKKVEELWLTRVWVPFIVVNNWEKEIWLSGSDNIKEYFMKNFPEVNEEIKKSETEKDSKKTIVIIIFILLATLLPIVLIRLSNKK